MTGLEHIRQEIAAEEDRIYSVFSSDTSISSKTKDIKSYHIQFDISLKLQTTEPNNTTTFWSKIASMRVQYT